MTALQVRRWGPRSADAWRADCCTSVLCESSLPLRSGAGRLLGGQAGRHPFARRSIAVHPAPKVCAPIHMEPVKDLLKIADPAALRRFNALGRR